MNTLVMRHCMTAALASSAMFQVGCADAPPIEGHVQVIDLLLSGDSLDTVHFDLFAPADQAFERHTGGGDLSALVRHQTPTERFGAQIETIDLIDGEPIRALYWSRTGAGAFVLHATIEHGENALTLFDPPLLLLPARLTTGEPVLAESSMRVVRADNPHSVRERGTGRQSITYVGRRRIQTPHELVESHSFEIEFRADLRFVDVVETTLIDRSETGQVIVEDSRQSISILGLPASQDRTVLIRSGSAQSE